MSGHWLLGGGIGVSVLKHIGFEPEQKCSSLTVGSSLVNGKAQFAVISSRARLEVSDAEVFFG
jgi:hypothetical protein